MAPESTQPLDSATYAGTSGIRMLPDRSRRPAELSARPYVELHRVVVNADDRRLIADTLDGRTDAFGELVRRYQDRLFNAVLRVMDNPEDAQDVVQDAFVNAYSSLGSFKGDAEFYTWLYRIAFNTAISARRKRRALISLETGREGE